MGKIKNIEALREEIRNLEHQNYVNEQHMRHRVADIADRLKPMNIVKNIFGQFFSSGAGSKTSLLKMAAGIATSFLVKKFLKKGIAAK
jgi:hypothetical protein